MSITSAELANEIRNVEGLNVGISAPPDTLFEHYPYKRAANGTMTVAELKEKRLRPSAKGYDVEVFDSTGSRINGQTTVANARNK